MTVEVILPIRLVNGANTREHWTKRSKRAKEQRTSTAWALSAAGRLPPLAGLTRVTVTITRIAPRKFDTDGLAISAKHVRDGVADWAGIDDGHSIWDWRYDQRKGEPKTYATHILVEAA